MPVNSRARRVASRNARDRACSPVARARRSPSSSAAARIGEQRLADAARPGHDGAEQHDRERRAPARRQRADARGRSDSCGSGCPKSGELARVHAVVDAEDQRHEEEPEHHERAAEHDEPSRTTPTSSTKRQAMSTATSDRGDDRARRAARAIDADDLPGATPEEIGEEPRASVRETVQPLQALRNLAPAGEFDEALFEGLRCRAPRRSVPAASTWPCTMIATWSQTRWMRSMPWLERIDGAAAGDVLLQDLGDVRPPRPGRPTRTARRARAPAASGSWRRRARSSSSCRPSSRRRGG